MFFFLFSGAHRDLPRPTRHFPTRRSSVLYQSGADSGAGGAEPALSGSRSSHVRRRRHGAPAACPRSLRQIEAVGGKGAGIGCRSGIGPTENPPCPTMTPALSLSRRSLSSTTIPASASDATGVRSEEKPPRGSLPSLRPPPRDTVTATGRERGVK